MIVHRTANKIVVLGQNKKSIKDSEPKGWNSPQFLPYRPYGVLNTVVPVIEELKS